MGLRCESYVLDYFEAIAKFHGKFGSGKELSITFLPRTWVHVLMDGGRNYVDDLLRDVHVGLDLPADVTEVALVSGEYLYYHYGCDGFDDRGWGCGYRTLMSLCSWVRGQLTSGTAGVARTLPPVPSNHRIQEILVEIGDKEKDFLGSKQWIGSVEVAYVIDTLYNIPCKLVHVSIGRELAGQMTALFHHFKTRGGPVMMGGETDVSSKGIMGVCKSATQSYLLVVDPHFWGQAKPGAALQTSEWVKWQPLSEFHESSFYNMCLPQHTAEQLTNHL